MAASRLFLLAALATFASSADAGLFRAYLSVSGSDANPCTVAAPCRLLPAALAAIDAGGEVWMLDSANYNTGPVTVSKAATILAVPGALGSLVASGGPALTINASTTLRNLNVLPLPGSAAFNGVEVQGVDVAASLEGCDISGFDQSNGVGLKVSNQARVDVSRSTFARNVGGIDVDSGARVRIADSRLIQNRAVGIQVGAETVGASTRATLERTSILGSTKAVTVLVLGGSFNNARAVVTDSLIEASFIGVELNASFGALGSAATLEMGRTTLVGAGSGYGVSVGDSRSSALLSDNTIVGTFSASAVYNLGGGTLATRLNNAAWPGTIDALSSVRNGF